MLVVWLSTSLVNRAFHGGWILPLLGILLLPITTLTYVLVYYIAGCVTGWGWLWLALAVLLDQEVAKAAVGFNLVKYLLIFLFSFLYVQERRKGCSAQSVASSPGSLL